MNKTRLEAFSDGVAIIITIMVLESVLKKAVGRDWKAIVSPFLYAVAIPVAFTSHWTSKAIYVSVALMWLVPDQRIERALARQEA
jgi:uncharacterized membrane protein